jgi:hypothetical protein
MFVTLGVFILCTLVYAILKPMMEKIQSFDIDQYQEGNIENKIITNHYYTPKDWKGRTFVRCTFKEVFQINLSSLPITLIFVDCTFESTIRIVKGLSGTISFSACKIKALVCEGDIDSINIDSFKNRKCYISSLVLRQCNVKNLNIEDTIVSTLIQHKCAFDYFSLKKLKIRDSLNSNFCFYQNWSFFDSMGIGTLRIENPKEKSNILHR